MKSILRVRSMSRNSRDTPRRNQRNGPSLSLAPEILDCEGYGVTEAQFRLHPTMPWYGLWAVSNEWKDVSDVASIKEQRSYRLMERPYQFLQATDKKAD